MKCKGIIIKLVAVLTVVLSIGVTAYGHCMRDYRANFGNSGVCQILASITADIKIVLMAVYVSITMFIQDSI